MGEGQEKPAMAAIVKAAEHGDGSSTKLRARTRTYGKNGGYHGCLG